MASFKICGLCDHKVRKLVRKCPKCGERPAWNKPTDAQIEQDKAEQAARNDLMNSFMLEMGLA